MAFPEKETWKCSLKRQGRHGLSASSFGAALGYCGRVADYVHYIRTIVGTDNEFRGNDATAHGIATEPLAKQAYECLFQVAVEDGGFFVDPSDRLACSPDGIVKWNELDECGNATLSALITQRIESPTIPATATVRRVPHRLLKIKSPFRYFYSSSREENQPHGVPHHYMCQMQGQMAISGAHECDFFIFVRFPRMMAVAFRVYRSEEFWSWAKPKLLEVVSWIECDEKMYTRIAGPYCGGTANGFLNRSFAFDPFDFRKIRVEPLLFPIDLVTGDSLLDRKVFSLFWDTPLDRRPPPPPGLKSPLLQLLTVGRMQPDDVVLCALSQATASRQRQCKLPCVIVIPSDSDEDEADSAVIVLPGGRFELALCQVDAFCTSATPVAVAVAATSAIPVGPCGSWRPLRQYAYVFTDAPFIRQGDDTHGGRTLASQSHSPLRVDLTTELLVPFLRRSHSSLQCGSSVVVLPPAIEDAASALRWVLNPHRVFFEILSVDHRVGKWDCIVAPRRFDDGEFDVKAGLTPASARSACCSSRVVGLGTDIVLGMWRLRTKEWKKVLQSKHVQGMALQSNCDDGVGFSSTNGWRVSSLLNNAHSTDVSTSKVIVLILPAVDFETLYGSIINHQQSNEFDDLKFASCLSSSELPTAVTEGTSGTAIMAPDGSPLVLAAAARVWLIVGTEMEPERLKSPITPRAQRPSSWGTNNNPPPVLLWLHDVTFAELSQGLTK